MKRTTTRTTRLASVAFLSITLAGGIGWYAAVHRPAKPIAPRVYVSEGYGGFVTPPAPLKAARAKAQTVSSSAATDPVRPLQEAYEAGHYLQAEAQAQAVIREAAQSHSVKQHTQAAFARQIMAYSAARRHDLPLAQARFAALRQEAARLPGRGVEPAHPGEEPATLEQEAAFQHAVCTGALGDSGAAEAEYVSFMKQYPDSPLLHAALLRMERMHGGNLPQADEAIWRQAKQTALTHQKMQTREASLCGPECLAELMRRRGETPDVHALAQAMGTSERGTTLDALAGAARAHGFSARGLALTPKGLAAQTLPVIALVAPGHYVLVEAVQAAGVTIWDPDASGIGHGGRRTVQPPVWGRMWQGMALALQPSVQGVRTAQR